MTERTRECEKKAACVAQANTATLWPMVRNATRHEVTAEQKVESLKPSYASQNCKL